MKNKYKTLPKDNQFGILSQSMAMEQIFYMQDKTETLQIYQLYINWLSDQ